MASILSNGKGLSVSSKSPVDFSLRVYTEEDIFGPNVLVVTKMFNGEVIRNWMTVFEATEYVLRNVANGISIMSSHIEFRGVFDEWGQSF